MNNGMPPRSRNHRLPAACDTPTTIAASSLVSPLAISRQNKRSTSRRSAGAPGDFIGDLPVNAFIHPAGLPIDTSTVEVLRRPVESAQYTSAQFRDLLARLGIRQSMGRTGSCFDNAAAESFFATLKREIGPVAWPTRGHARMAVFRFIEIYYNRNRQHSTVGYLTPYEARIRYSQAGTLAA
jgi:putative transposase